MALMQVNFLSKSLMRPVTMQVILPVDKLVFPGMPEREEKPFKTLYLLHGIIGNYTDWVSGTNIQRWAQERNLAVVMPSGENMFYLDREDEHNFYGEFIGQELVEVTRRMFPLSRKREDTFIAGLSMGGYGALRNGLKYHDNFGNIAVLSGGFVTEGLEKRTDDAAMFFETRRFAQAVFGKPEEVKDSDKNPKWLIRKLKEEKIDFPSVYVTCGTEDPLLEANRDMVRYMKENGLPVTYVEGPGGHEWDFWGRTIKDILDWLPLEDSNDGVNSGNVGI